MTQGCAGREGGGGEGGEALQGILYMTHYIQIPSSKQAASRAKSKNFHIIHPINTIPNAHPIPSHPNEWSRSRSRSRLFALQPVISFNLTDKKIPKNQNQKAQFQIRSVPFFLSSCFSFQINAQISTGRRMPNHSNACMNHTDLNANKKQQSKYIQIFIHMCDFPTSVQ